MGIKTESQVVIECDTCGILFVEAYPRKVTITMARVSGWKIGKHVTCPKCYAKIFNRIPGEGQ